MGAAWTSVGGVAWQPTQVEGDGEHVELRRVFVGADGLTAVRTLTDGNQATVWVTRDATAWSLLPGEDDGIRLPEVSEGRTIVVTSRRPAGVLDWWASADGVTWSQLASTGEVGTAPRWDWAGSRPTSSTWSTTACSWSVRPSRATSCGWHRCDRTPSHPSWTAR